MSESANQSRLSQPIDKLAIAEILPVKDRIVTNTITEKRSVVIEVRAIKTIPTPVDSYSYL